MNTKANVIVYGSPKSSSNFRPLTSSLCTTRIDYAKWPLSTFTVLQTSPNTAFITIKEASASTYMYVGRAASAFIFFHFRTFF